MRLYMRGGRRGSAHTNPIKVLQNKVCRLILNAKRR